MIELKCQNCGSSDLEYKNGIFICKSCDSKFLPEKGEIPPAKRKEEKMVERMLKLNEKKDRCDSFDDDDIDKYLRYSEEIDILVDRILKINDKNIYALAIGILQRICNGIKYSWDAELIVHNAELILEYATDEEMDDVKDAVTLNFLHHKKSVLEVKPDLKERVKIVSDQLKAIAPEWKYFDDDEL